MSEFLNLLSDSKLIDLAAEAEANHLTSAEALIRRELEERQLARFALSNGVYDASRDLYINPPEPPQKWAIEGGVE